VALAAVLGHCFSPYLRFRGGKGVATAGGAICAIEPLAFLVALVVFFLVLAGTRVTALGSIALGFALAATVVLREPSTAFEGRWPVSAVAIFLAFFLVWTHRSNIRGLLRLRQQRKVAG
jgi:glycerol-3-phosphate acyltransferase PlsY